MSEPTSEDRRPTRRPTSALDMEAEVGVALLGHGTVCYDKELMAQWWILRKLCHSQCESNSHMFTKAERGNGVARGVLRVLEHPLRSLKAHKFKLSCIDQRTF